MKLRQLILGQRIRRRLIRAGFAVALVVGTSAATSIAASASTGAPDSASVIGSGSGNLPGDLFPQWAGDPINFTVDAQGASGTFDVTHRRSDGSLYTQFSGSVTSLTAAGQLAIVNGVITAADDPANPGLTLVGAKVALTFDIRPDGAAQVGFVWGFAGQPVSAGQGAVPFFKLASSTVVVTSTQPGPSSTRPLPDPPTQVPARHLTGTVTGTDPTTGGHYTLTTNAAVAVNSVTTTAQGTFTYTLYQPDIAKSTTYSGTITCLDIGGDDAVATGQITASTTNPSLIGKKAAWSIYDNGTTDWLTASTDAPSTPIHACQGPLPTSPTTTGHITATS